MIDGKVVKATLRGVNIEVVFELTPKQYVHYRYLLPHLVGQYADEAMPLDQGTLAEMQALLEHLK